MSMTIILESNIQQKLAILGGEASDEVTDVPATDRIRQGIKHSTGFIYNTTQEGGGTSRLFKMQGIDPRSAERIIEARRETKLRDLSELKALGVMTGWAAPYVLPSRSSFTRAAAPHPVQAPVQDILYTTFCGRRIL